MILYLKILRIVKKIKNSSYVRFFCYFSLKKNKIDEKNTCTKKKKKDIISREKKSKYIES